MKKIILSVFLFLGLIPIAVFADDEASNSPVVRASEYGRSYAKSLPAESYGDKGKTLIYGVRTGTDVLFVEYPWYSYEIYLGGAGDGTVVRFGTGRRGRVSRSEDVAIGFYSGTKVLREYSTADLEKMGSGISTSLSHYWVFGKRLGFRWQGGNKYVYEVNGASGKKFTFDLDTGELSKDPDLTSDGRPLPKN